MKELKRLKLDMAIVEHVANAKVLLGICLGMQLLFESSKESQSVKGLGILKGTVARLKATRQFKVPHIGWNQIKLRKQGCALLRHIPCGSHVYFCHSYYAIPCDSSCIAAQTDYSEIFASVIWKDNVYAAQFHPEKSQLSGLRMIDNFVRLL